MKKAKRRKHALERFLAPIGLFYLLFCGGPKSVRGINSRHSGAVCLANSRCDIRCQKRWYTAETIVCTAILWTMVCKHCWGTLDTGVRAPGMELRPVVAADQRRRDKGVQPFGGFEIFVVSPRSGGSQWSRTKPASERHIIADESGQAPLATSWSANCGRSAGPPQGIGWQQRRAWRPPSLWTLSASAVQQIALEWPDTGCQPLHWWGEALPGSLHPRSQRCKVSWDEVEALANSPVRVKASVIKTGLSSIWTWGIRQICSCLNMAMDPWCQPQRMIQPQFGANVLWLLRKEQTSWEQSSMLRRAQRGGCPRILSSPRSFRGRQNMVCQIPPGQCWRDTFHAQQPQQRSTAGIWYLRFWGSWTPCCRRWGVPCSSPTGQGLAWWHRQWCRQCLARLSECRQCQAPPCHRFLWQLWLSRLMLMRSGRWLLRSVVLLALSSQLQTAPECRAAQQKRWTAAVRLRKRPASRARLTVTWSWRKKVFHMMWSLCWGTSSTGSRWSFTVNVLLDCCGVAAKYPRILWWFMNSTASGVPDALTCESLHWAGSEKCECWATWSCWHSLQWTFRVHVNLNLEG